MLEHDSSFNCSGGAGSGEVNSDERGNAPAAAGGDPSQLWVWCNVCNEVVFNSVNELHLHFESESHRRYVSRMAVVTGR